MILLGADFVVVLLPVQVHQVQFVNQAHALEQVDGAVDGGSVDIRIALASLLQQPLRIQMRIRVLNGFNHGAALWRQPHTLRLDFTEQFAPL